MDEMTAAQTLVIKLNAPPQAHSVYVRTKVGPDGQFIKEICCSIHPKFIGQVIVPPTIEGFPVVQTEWPKPQAIATQR